MCRFCATRDMGFQKEKKVCLTVNGFPGHSPITITVMKCNYSSTVHPGNCKYTVASKHFLEPEVKSHLKIVIVFIIFLSLLEKLVQQATRFDIVRSGNDFHTFVHVRCRKLHLKQIKQSVMCWMAVIQQVALCVFVQGSLLMFCASLWEELQQKLASFEMWVFRTKCHTGHSLLYRVFLMTHFMCWLTTTVYDFYGITDQVGSAILECGFQALPGERVRLLRICYTNSEVFEI